MGSLGSSVMLQRRREEMWRPEYPRPCKSDARADPRTTWCWRGLKGQSGSTHPPTAVTNVGACWTFATLPRVAARGPVRSKPLAYHIDLADHSLGACSRADSAFTAGQDGPARPYFRDHAGAPAGHPPPDLALPHRKWIGSSRVLRDDGAPAAGKWAPSRHGTDQSEMGET
jgi:hypothetical protein